tara:strand:- start:78700 stop:79422 length:723 start_codon:yes stop_codon:yes gene_type:complete
MNIQRWEEYQSFFQLIILRYLVVWFSLVPVVASFVSQFPDTLPVTISGITYQIELTLPFNWQLLWIASLFFVISLGIYKARCPKFIHKYNNYSDYSSYQHHPRWLTSEMHMLLKIANKKQKKFLLKRLLDKKYVKKLDENIPNNLCEKPIVLEKQTIINFKIENSSYQFGMPIIDIKNNNNIEKDIFYEIFGRYSESRSISRFFIFLLLSIALVLFLVTLAQHIINGGAFTLSWLCGLFN